MGGVWPARHLENERIYATMLSVRTKVVDKLREQGTFRLGNAVFLGSVFIKQPS